MGGVMSSIVISGDTSGTITIAAPAVAGTNTLTLPAATGTVALTSSLPSSSQLASAWVTFSGTTINASYNVSSVTLFATGRYTINLTNALTDTNYCVIPSVLNSVSSDYSSVVAITNSSSFIIGTFSSDGTYITPSKAFAVVFR
jgi:hypothetical protein